MIMEMYEKASPFYRALIVFCACTGMRIGEALNARMSWIDFASDPPRITIPGQYTKTKQERITFLTPEAARHVRDIAVGDMIFDKSYQAVWNYMDALRYKCGFTERGANGQHHVKIHKFRAFAENKIARAVDSEYAHTILGHTKDLIQYNQGGTSEDEYAEDFKKAVPALTITTNHKLIDENEKLRQQNNAIKSVQHQQEMIMAFLQAHPKLAKEFARFQV
jgi:integrase